MKKEFRIIVNEIYDGTKYYTAEYRNIYFPFVCGFWHKIYPIEAPTYKFAKWQCDEEEKK